MITQTVYQLPNWAETVLVLCIALMLSGLAAYLACKAITEALNAAGKLEQKRRKSETKALNNWQKLYQEEHDNRISDNSTLINKITELQTENERMKKLLAKTKLSDIERAVKA